MQAKILLQPKAGMTNMVVYKFPTYKQRQSGSVQGIMTWTNTSNGQIYVIWCATRNYCIRLQTVIALLVIDFNLTTLFCQTKK